MSTYTCVLLGLFVALCAALPAEHTVLRKLDPGLRYQYATDSKGESHLVDLWLTLDDMSQLTRYNPTVSNSYHLFTRSNPTVSQPLLVNNKEVLRQSNYDSHKRTVFLIHGWRDDALSEMNTVLVPAFLAAADVNVVVVDWSAGASSLVHRLVVLNTITSGEAVAEFIKWLTDASGSSPDQLHLVGHGFGGHQAGIVGRNLDGRINYITGLDPALIGWVTNFYRFQPNDGLYTEVIHTNYAVFGYPGDLGKVDFYPNAGISMPGCDSNECDHSRSYYYFAESLTRLEFIGKRCLNYYAALLSMCNNLPGTLHMGGLVAKTGRTGVYLVETNASPPFAQGQIARTTP